VPGTVRGGETSRASRISFWFAGAEVARAGVNAQAAADQISENNEMASVRRGISA